ncbi:MAG: hypothetical protein OEW67_00670 [Cyclobacteriaceae bacterium]|nr:hypothetical protein [Cyclobacteriaceae bacterium]
MTKYNPYLSIWFNTPKTIDSILTGKSRFTLYLPIILTLCSLWFSILNDAITLGLPLTIGMMIIAFALGYLILTHLLPRLIILTGKIWNGKSGIPELKIIIGLAQIPMLLILTEQIIFLLFGEILPHLAANIVLQWLVWIFYLRIMIIGVAKVQGFNYTIALVNLIISFSPIFIIDLIILLNKG